MGGEEYTSWRNHFLLLLDRIPTPIAVCRADGEVTVANPAMAAEWGTAPGRLRGRNLQELFRPRAIGRLDRHIEALRLGRRPRHPIEVRWVTGADGIEREGELLVDPVGDAFPANPMLLAILRVRTDPSHRPVEPMAEVSVVEGNILALAAAGATTAAIGKAVGLTVDGVNYHLTRLTRRWRVPNRTALVAKAYVLGVLSTREWPPAPAPAPQRARGACRSTQSPHIPPGRTR
ncbi:PAS domain-containing protein [Streptomyces sp. NPDC020799]|uniref:PAS domain-containing protein n=1 Tax=unclassified Streptomyces TaxID=2593676 RepID=UPI0034087C1D